MCPWSCSYTRDQTDTRVIDQRQQQLDRPYPQASTLILHSVWISPLPHKMMVPVNSLILDDQVRPLDLPLHVSLVLTRSPIFISNSSCPTKLSKRRLASPPHITGTNSLFPTSNSSQTLPCGERNSCFRIRETEWELEEKRR